MSGSSAFAHLPKESTLAREADQLVELGNRNSAVGTDISLYVLVRSEYIDDEGEEYWLTAIDGDGLFLNRNYDLFCRLGGVRCLKSAKKCAHWYRGRPPWFPKQLETGFSDEFFPTWLTPAEFVPIIKSMERREDDGGWLLLADFVALLERTMGSARVRVVMAFW